MSSNATTTATHNNTREKKPIEYYFVDMASPDRFSKLKVSQASDFCRRRKSKCDVGIPGSRSCSNCRKAGVVCIFAKHRQHGTSSASATPKMKASGKASSAFKSKKSKRQRVLVMTGASTTTPPTTTTTAAVNDQERSSPPYHQNLVQWIYGVFPSLDVNNTCTTTTYPDSNISSFVYSHPQQSLEDLERELLDVYFCDIHPLFPVLDDHYQHHGHMSHLLRCALLALTCAVTRPNMLTLASSYADQANEQLERSPANIDTMQVMLILYKYQEMTTGLSPLGYSTPSYLDRARDMHHRLWPLNMHDPAIHRIRSMLYLIAFWSGLIEQRSTWIKWCSDCEAALEHFSSGHGGLDALVQITTRYRKGLIHHGDYFYIPTTLEGSVYELYWSVIHDMTFLSSHNIYAAERIEQHVSHLLGTVTHHSCILGSHMLIYALKLALHTYIGYYASATSSLPTTTLTNTHDDPRDDIAIWTHTRLTQLSQLFYELGAQPEISISIQQLIHMLCDSHLQT